MSVSLQQISDISDRQNGKKLAIMQPYFLPYVGYWQMMHAADEFVVYDDVQFTRGWINRNRMLWNGIAETFTIPLLKGSSRVGINERYLTGNWDEARRELLHKITRAYAKAPNFSLTMPLIEQILDTDKSNLADFLYDSLLLVRDHLGISSKLMRSSKLGVGQDLQAAERILAIGKARDTDVYINAPGGRELYDKAEFRSHGIDLRFILSDEITYPQFGDVFVSGLSILDVMMFNDRAAIRTMLESFTLD